LTSTITLRRKGSFKTLPPQESQGIRIERNACGKQLLELGGARAQPDDALAGVEDQVMPVQVSEDAVEGRMHHLPRQGTLEILPGERPVRFLESLFDHEDGLERGLVRRHARGKDVRTYITIGIKPYCTKKRKKAASPTDRVPVPVSWRPAGWTAADHHAFSIATKTAGILLPAGNVPDAKRGWRRLLDATSFQRFARD
jgi:hypothetical protein